MCFLPSTASFSSKAVQVKRAAPQPPPVAVELDALPGEVLKNRLVREVEARMDLEALDRTREAERCDRERLAGLLRGETS